MWFSEVENLLALEDVGKVSDQQSIKKNFQKCYSLSDNEEASLGICHIPATRCVGFCLWLKQLSRLLGGSTERSTSLACVLCLRFILRYIECFVQDCFHC